MSEEEIQKRPAPVPGKVPQHEAVEDPRARALADALQSSFKVVRVLMVVLVIAFLGSGIVTVKQNEIGIKLSFGQAGEEPLQPGLGWAFPYPIDEVVYISVDDTKPIKSYTGWHTSEKDEDKGEEAFETASFQPTVDGYTLTGDRNTIHVKAIMKYKLDKEDNKTMRKFVFNFANVDNFLQCALDNAVFYASARTTALDAYTKPEMLRESIEGRVEKVAKAHGLDIQIAPLDLEVTVPLGVKRAYDDSVTAQQENQQAVQAAEAEARGTVSNAEGQARVITNDGRTRGGKLLASVQAEAQAFAGQLPYYRGDPVLFKQRLLAETMQRVLTNAQETFFLSGREPRMWLSRPPRKPKKEEDPFAQ